MPTFSQLLRENGYRTAVTGKWQLATLEHHPDHVVESGFESWCIWQIWRTNSETGQGEKTTRYWNPTYNLDGQIMKGISKSFGPDVLVDYVISKMSEAVKASEPFLIVHNELLPHWPMVQTPDDMTADPQRPASLKNMIAYMDKLVKRLLDAIDNLGIRDNTYVVFMGDNGTDEPYFTNPWKDKRDEGPHTRHTVWGNVDGGKFSVTDGGTHVPMIWWGAKSIPGNSVENDLVDIVDIFPTFCDLSGTPIPSGLELDGHSIVSQIHGIPGHQREFTHGASGNKEAVFDGSWRLKGTGELIDARELPEEKLTEADDPVASAARNRLESIIKDLTSN